jgi:hypothetical protein
MERKEQEPTIEELISKIQFLKQALEFYAAEYNYRTGSIERDQGHQARFALSQIVNIDKYNDSIESALDEIKYMRDNTLNSDDIDNDFQLKMNEINKIIKKYSDPDE